MKNNTFAPRKVTLTEKGYAILPGTMKDHVDCGGSLWLVEEPANGCAFLSTAKDPNGSICTIIHEEHVVVPGKDKAETRDLGFVQENATVWYVNRGCEDEPVREATVVTIYSSGSVDLWDEYLGYVSVDIDELYASSVQAQAAYDAE